MLHRSSPSHRRRATRFHLLVAAIAVGVGAGAAAHALATPGAGAVSNYVARGPVAQSVVIGVPRTATATRTVRIRVPARTVRIRVAGRTVRVRVAGTTITRRVPFTYQTVTPLMTCGTSTPCDTAYQQLTIAPGGHTGWHTHPGPTFVAVAEGQGTLYHGMSGCPSTRYGVGSGFMQPSTEVHNMRNEGSTPLVLWAFYALPAGTSNAAIRVDQPQPGACTNIP
jgi:mannose-6-phosphate isomerase-like protein (cupin superfamily)